jgi:hypothetical protein
MPSLEEWPTLPFTARVQRGPSDSLTFPEGVGRLFFTARIERPQLYRGGSASKKNSLPATSHHSEGARSGSKESSSHPYGPVFKMDLAQRRQEL